MARRSAGGSGSIGRLVPGKFILNKRWGAHILHNDPGVKKAIKGIATEGAHKAGGHVETYNTDRFVAAIVVGEEDQAKHGSATRAVGQLGLTPAARTGAKKRRGKK